MAPHGLQHHIREQDQNHTHGQHPQGVKSRIGYHPVVDVHGENGHRQCENVDEQSREQHILVDRRIGAHGRPEPVALAGGIGDIHPIIETKFGTGQQNMTCRLPGQVVNSLLDRRIHQSRVDDISAAVAGSAQVDAGVAILKQQNSGANSLGDVRHRQFTHAAVEPGALGRALQQVRGQALGIKGQAGAQGFGRGGEAMVPGYNDQARQKHIIFGLTHQGPPPTRTHDGLGAAGP